jgi:hypothetical protein
VFHYSYSERLTRAYRSFFETDAKVDQNRRAYLSFGPTMNSTRFYFADAAAQRMYCGQRDLQALFDESAELHEELHHTLAWLVVRFLKVRSGNAP